MPPKKVHPVGKPAANSAPKPTGRPTASRQPAGTKRSGIAAAKSGAVGKNVAAKKESTGPGKKLTKGKDPAGSQTKSKSQTKQEKSAVVIQKYARRYLAKKELEKKRKGKQEYEDLMDKLQKEAWLQLVQMERDEAEKERVKEEEERKRRKEESNRRKRILEAAFDGDNDEILAVLEEAYEQDSKQLGLSDAARELLIERHQLTLVDCEDANNNTPMSEAGGGGHADTIKLLIQRGGDINSRGRYQRTPVWRAAFGGHLQAVQILLEHGADPRLLAEDATNAVQVAAIPVVEQVLRDWDITQTEVLLKKLEAQKKHRRGENMKRKQAESDRLEEEISRATKENQVCQKELRKAYEELNKRIFEHDKCMVQGKTDKKDITLQAIHDAEAILELAKKKAETAKEKLQQANLKLREQHKEDEASEGDVEQLKGVKVFMKELDDVLFRDVGGKIAADGRWPLLIDPSSQSSTFLRYRDTNFLNAVNPKDMEPEVIRLAILGAVRYGKPAVIDMMDVDMFDSLALKFDLVQQDLLASILSKEFLNGEKYMELVRPADGEEYSKTNFLGARVDRFLFVLLTKQWNPPSHVMELTYPIRVIIPQT